MATQVAPLLTRLEDPNETFSTQEVQELMSYAEQRAANDIYLTSKLATVMQTSVATQAIVNNAMQQLISMWDTTPIEPTLIEVSHEQA